MIIHAEPGSTVVAVLHGDMHIRDGHPVYQVSRFPVAARPVSAELARQQPSRLLAAECQVVPFGGRQQQLASLSSWRDDTASGVSVMLIHGPGGQGKSRLAAQFAADCVQASWMVWAARHLSDPTGEWVVSPGEPGPDLALIADYADRWPVSDLLLLLNNPLLRHSRRTRVLLIARSAGPWWPAIRHRLGEAGIDVSQAMRLPPLAETIAARRGAFIEAGEAFAGALRIQAPPVPAPDQLDGAAFDLVLTVHMAALVAVDARHRGLRAPSDPIGLSAYLLDREYDFWRALHDHEQIATTPAVMGRTVYTATLTHQLSRNQAVQAMDRVGIADAGTALDDHAACYPPVQAGSDVSLEPLYPDRLGEDFLALTTPGHSHHDYPTDRWAESAPARLLVHADPEPPSYTRPAVTALIETARRWPHMADRQLSPLMRERPQLAVAAGGAALIGLASLPELDLSVLESVEGQLPPGRHVDLDIGMAAIADRLTTRRLAEISDAGQRAALYHALGNRFSNAGLLTEALAAMTSAVRIREQLAAADTGAHDAELALSLNNLAKTLTDLGQNEQALAVATRAVGTYRRLLPADQAATQADLARALNNLAAVLAALGRADDALAAIEEAAEIRQSLAAGNPAEHEPDLALTVTNVGVISASLGRIEQAVAASAQAVEILRRLAARNPAAYAPDLARALSNAAADLRDAGRAPDASEAIGEAVDVYRSLTRSNQAAHEPGLATALSNLAVQLSATGHSREALAVIEEVTQIRRRLAADSAVAYAPALAGALDKRGVMLAEAGHPQDAQVSIEEAVRIRQRLADRNPRAGEPALTESLSNLGKLLSDSGRYKQAIGVCEHAVGLYRRLAAANPVAHEAGLARALGTLGLARPPRRNLSQALAATNESVSIYRRLALAGRAGAESGLARALYGFALVRAAARKELPAALGAATEAIQIMGRSAGERPPTVSEALLAAYAVAADLLDQLGSAEEAATIRRQMARLPVDVASSAPNAAGSPSDSRW